jgi:hypothetical protein
MISKKGKLLKGRSLERALVLHKTLTCSRAKLRASIPARRRVFLSVTLSELLAAELRVIQRQTWLCSDSGATVGRIFAEVLQGHAPVMPQPLQLGVCIIGEGCITIVQWPQDELLSDCMLRCGVGDGAMAVLCRNLSPAPQLEFGD